MTDFLISLSSNIVFSLLLIIIGWMISYFTDRKRIYSFFKIKKTKKINFYISNLRIHSGGTTDINNTPSFYVGDAVSKKEFQITNIFKDRLNFLNLKLSDNPSLLSKILLSDIIINIEASVNEQSDIDNSTTIISIGSSKHNIVSKYIEEQENSIVSIPIDAANWSIHIKGINPMKNEKYGFIQRIFDSSNERFLFYIAGITEIGTIGAAEYLSKNWKNLYKQYKDNKNFLIVIEFNENNNKIIYKNDWI